ncbi:MAG: hypothetical protein ABGY42_12990 [bacterium]
MKPDFLFVKAGFFPTEPFVPTDCNFKITLSNAGGTFYEGELLPGDLPKRGHMYYFRDRTARAGGTRDGILWTQLSKMTPGYWRFQFKAFEDLSEATVPTMTLRLDTCDNAYALTADWSELRSGFKLELKTLP